VFLTHKSNFEQAGFRGFSFIHRTVSFVLIMAFLVKL